MHRSRHCDTFNNLGSTASRSRVVTTLSQSTPHLPSPSLPSTSSGYNIVTGSVSAYTRPSIESQVHGSMENLYRPVNYRSTSGSRTRSKKNRERKAGKGLELFAKKPNNHKLYPSSMDETQMLYLALDEGRKKVLLRKAACSFLYGALCRQSERIALLDTGVKIKSQEAAARLILHHLLLNSYRKREKEMDLLIKANTELHKTVENLNLQIRVVRHLQVTEKDRGIEKTHEINSLKDKLLQLQDLLNTSQAQLTNVEEESRNAHADKQKFEEEACRIREEMKDIQEQFEYLTTSLELETKRAGKLAAESFSQKRMITELKRNVDEMTRQSSQWQERARSLESTTYELTHQIENCERELDIAHTTCKTLNQDLFDNKEKRLVLKKQNEELQSQIRTSTKESSKLKRNISVLMAELENKMIHNSELEETFNNIKKENDLILKELTEFKLKNLRKRRIWTNLLGSLVSPIESLRYLFFGLPGPTTLQKSKAEQKAMLFDHRLI